MRFWDTSAVVPLIIDQPASTGVRMLMEDDPDMVVWWGTSVECWSALARLRREDRLTGKEEESVHALLDVLRAHWAEILPSENVQRRAGRLLRFHPLRAADALQLAAALEWAGVTPSGELVTFDERLKEAARLEGFNVP